MHLATLSPRLLAQITFCQQSTVAVNDVIFVSDSDAAAVTVTFVKTNNGTTTIDCASGTALGGSVWWGVSAPALFLRVRYGE